MNQLLVFIIIIIKKLSLFNFYTNLSTICPSNDKDHQSVYPRNNT